MMERFLRGQPPRVPHPLRGTARATPGTLASKPRHTTQCQQTNLYFLLNVINKSQITH